MKTSNKFCTNKKSSIKKKTNSCLELTSQLAQFAYEVGSQAPATGEVDYLVREADAYLKRLRDRNEVLEKQYNYAKKNSE